MMKKTKIWLVAAASLVLLGCVIFAGVMSVLKWDFRKLSTIKYATNRYEVNENFKDISIATDTADVVFVPSDDDKSSVVCYEQENMKHSVKCQDGTLVIKLEDSRKWYQYIGINFSSPKITVYVPRGLYGALTLKASTGDVEIPVDFEFESVDVSVSTGHVKAYASTSGVMKIKATTGNIFIKGVSAGELQLSASTGDIAVDSVVCVGEFGINVGTGNTKLQDVKCKNIISNGSTGDIIFKNVIAVENFSVKRSTGDVKLDICDAAELMIKTDTGDVTGNLLSEKVFITRTDTGHVNVPKTVTGGKCEIETDTGSIKITIED